MGLAVSLGNSVDDNDRHPEPFDHARAGQGHPDLPPSGRWPSSVPGRDEGGRGIRASCVAVDAGAILEATNAAATFLPDAPFLRQGLPTLRQGGKGDDQRGWKVG
jgi:hypothetical protein